MINKNKPNVAAQKVTSAHVISLNELNKLCLQLKFKISDDNLLHLKVYLELLVKWNKVMNLVGISKWRAIFSNLIVDSFFLSKHIQHLQRNSEIVAEPTVFDLGAGAGIPGIPLRILWQNGNYYMLESMEKRAIFLSTVLEKIPLPQTSVFMGRVEDFAAEKNIMADLIVSRAFMPWEKTLPLIENMLSPNGKVIFLASEPAPEKLIDNWQIDSTKLYRIQYKKRYFWIVSRKSVK